VPHAHLFGGEQSPGTQTIVTALQIEGLPDMRNLLQVEWLILPSSTSLPIEDFCDLAIAVSIQQRVDLSNDLRFCFSNLSDWQWLGQRESPRGATAETYMGLDHLSVGQCHILDEQPEDAFPLTMFD